MSVYTNVSFDELAAWLLRYALSPLVDLAPIASGIENTNYFVTTENERLVLTLYERLPAEDLPFYLNLMAHLAQHGVPAPTPIADRSGTYFSVLNNKPASLVTRLDGAPPIGPRCIALRADRPRAGAVACGDRHLPRPACQPARRGLAHPGRARRKAVSPARRNSNC